METGLKAFVQSKKQFCCTKFLLCLPTLSLLLLFYIQASPFAFASFSSPKSVEDLIAKLRDSVTFLPLKDTRLAETAMTGSNWFMSSLNDTYQEDEPQYLYFPSQASKGRILCIRGRSTSDGTKNSYALAWPESLPDHSTLLKGVTYVSETYYNHDNLWHGISAMAPLVRWSMRHGCEKPARWVLFHWGELRTRMGSWLQKLMEANFGKIEVEKFVGGDGPYCFEKALVMRHDMGRMGRENKRVVFDLLRCRAREACGFNPSGKGREVNERGVPIIRLTLLMRRGSRSFKNATAVRDIFAKECERVDGCVLNVAQSEDLSFCDQVRVMTNTDIVASPHGAQLTNMIFMDRGSSVMEFFPKGWLEHAGTGQYAHHWMADQSGMQHRGAWWEPKDEDCPYPTEDKCFYFYKNGQVGHDETYFTKWARKVLEQVRTSKLEQASMNNTVSKPQPGSRACVG
ncbi:Protein O-GlcNAc transferase [Bertholletia excelsa]